MSTLRDPSLPPHAIVEEYEDGGALRNDGVRLKPANRNPWYVLATIWGEQGGNWIDAKLAAQNRDTWNAWADGRLTGEERGEVLQRFRTRLGDSASDLPNPKLLCNFRNTHFTRPCQFDGYVFPGKVFFDCSHFQHYTSFLGTQFKDEVFFENTYFNDTAVFSQSKFHRNSWFTDSHFAEMVYFQQAVLHWASRFWNVVFCGKADFKLARFQRGIGFRRTTFHKEADFSSAIFEASTRFDNARFLTHVPEFHAADLYDDTVFTLPDRHKKNWPKKFGGDYMPAGDQKRAYSRLRLFYAKTQQIDEEQFFHRQEMRCKRELAKGPTRALYSLYALLSDYGISIWRPLAAMGVLITLGAALFSFHTGMQGTPPAGSTFWQGMGWSLANALPFTGFGRTYFGAEFYQALPTWLKIYAGAQTLAALPLLFLLGLGLRNTFRLR